MKSRLKKVAIMAPDMFEKQIDQIGEKGRDVLKAIEDYKFFIEQVSRVVKNDPGATQMIINKKKNLEQASQQIYDVVFDIENMDITTSYYNQQQNTEISKGPAPTPGVKPPMPNPGQNQPPIPGGAPNPTQNPTPPKPPIPPNNDSKEESDKENEEDKKDKDEEEDDKKDKNKKEDSSKDE